MTWCETKAKIISYESTHTHCIKELPLPVSHWHRKSQTAPDKVPEEPCKNQSGTTWESNVPELSLSWYWTGICYLAGLSWQICFEYIIYPVLCSWFFIFPFTHASAFWPVLSSSSQAPSPWRLSPQILYTAAPGLNPLLKFLVRTN